MLISKEAVAIIAKGLCATSSVLLPLRLLVLCSGKGRHLL